MELSEIESVINRPLLFQLRYVCDSRKQLIQSPIIGTTVVEQDKISLERKLLVKISLLSLSPRFSFYFNYRTRYSRFFSRGKMERNVSLLYKSFDKRTMVR